ncbi:MAG TPA: ATP-dependent DNA helicase RecG [Aggregatilineales bacterium]|nr:ATP-dependent DNA helicase RecG [Aggregatilineales bacterium]
MPSALETLVKILKLEQDTSYQNKAVIGGLKSFADHWVIDAHAQAKKPEHHALIDELATLLDQYVTLETPIERSDAVRYMLGRIMGRVPPEAALAPRQDKARPRRRRERDPQRERDVREALRASVEILDGVGPKMAEKLTALGIATIEDLLYCFPRRYDDYTRLLPLNKLEPGLTVTVIGTVRSTVLLKGKRNVDVFNVTIDDGAGTLTATFFGQPYLRTKLEKGAQVVFSGKTDLFAGHVVMNNPEWELLEREALHTRSIVPVYPLTKGLSAHMIRKFTRTAVDRYTSSLPDYMPDSVLDRTDLASLGWAISQIHYPASPEALKDARRRLVFDELILLQLGVLRQRRDWQRDPGQTLPVSDEWLQAFMAALPYTLTGAQHRAIEAIRDDIARAVPMNRLLQGDVGSGKTIVAAVAMAIAAANGCQAAIMSPTSILAEQHYRGISAVLKSSPIGDWVNVKLLTGATPAQERNEILWGLGEGSVHIVIGTHALLEEPVNFQRLGLVVIDEQHRFGVEQRGKLRGKGANPHLLVMTATPIPRTLALTMYADLDLTVLDEMPPGRMPIDTRVLLAKERERAYSFIRSQIAKGRQAFIVYPLVEASENEDMVEVRSAVEDYERLGQDEFPDLTVGLLHGRLSPVEKDAVMSAFSRGEIQVLVSTSVVEVGIDVPNASVILVEGANRFGLAQLHQFRGRVGRGEHPSFCLLISDSGETSNERLQAMEATTDGFKLAEIDWNLRGAGDLLGTRQSGGAARLTDLMDVKTVEAAQFEARTLVEEDPDLALPEHAALRERIRHIYGDVSNADVS